MREPLTYSVPPELAEGVEVGKRVLVPLRGRRVVGFVVGVGGEPPEEVELRDVVDVVDESPLFDEGRLAFFKWVSDYYFASLGLVLKAAHPGGLGVSVRKVYSITERGRREAESIEGPAGVVLKTLALSGALDESRLRALVDGLRRETLHSLARRGLLEVSYELRSRPRTRVVKILKALPSARRELETNRRLGPAKRAMLEYLLDHSPADYDELKDLFGDVSRHIGWFRKRRLVEVEERTVYRDPYASLAGHAEPVPELNPDQKRVCERLSEALLEGGYRPFLLYGVTGSGKTEVYLRLVAEALERGREALVLVPEISLTPQLVGRFRARFGRGVAVVHSALSEGERYDAWRMAAAGDVKVVVGARSAVFAPLRRLGVIVVDEEHDPSYKQEEAPCYNARDLALVRGRMEGAVVVLGSATPSLESYANSLRGKLELLRLPLRVEDRPLPVVEVVDMRRAGRRIVSKQLERALKDNYRRGGQSILFLNRRGFSSLLLREGSGEVVMCPNCTVPLTYHLDDDAVVCHFCGTRDPYEAVEDAVGEPLAKVGVGTEKLEETVKKIVPGARVARMDRDTASGKRRLLDLYERVRKGEVDILVGTQMVAKGHDLPGVTLVGVVSADMMLGIPDFRAGERTFQLLTQVAGRSGRGDEPGRVIVQTYNPAHRSIRYAVGQDALGFLESELEMRRELAYPPFTRLVNFRLHGPNEDEAREAARELARAARRELGRLPPGSVDLTGPSPACIYKARNRYRWQLLARSESLAHLRRFTAALLRGAASLFGGGRVRVDVDVDPMEFL